MNVLVSKKKKKKNTHTQTKPNFRNVYKCYFWGLAPVSFRPHNKNDDSGPQLSYN